MLIVGTFTSFGSSYKMKLRESEGYTANAEFDNTISEPSGKSLEMIGQFDESIGMPYTMYIEGDFLYIASPWIGFIKMDISDSTRPNILGIHGAENEQYGGEFCIQDNIAYFADFFYLRILNITDFNNAVELERITDFSYCGNVKAYSNLLIVNDCVGYIRFYDITNPANLVLQNSLNLTHLEFKPYDFEYVDDILYIIGNHEDNSTLVIYDVTNINSPVYIGNYTTPYDSRGTKVKIDGSIAYVMTQYEFQVLNITIPASPSLIYSKTLSQNFIYLCDMILVEETVYILNSSSLLTFDVSNSSDIHIIDEDIEHPYLQDFAFKDDYLYLSNPSYYELAIYDTLTPNNPQKTATFSFGGNCNDVCVDNKIAYLANRTNGTRIIDVSDSKNPQLIGSYSDGDSIDFVQVSGSILYALSYQNCLKLIDISNPSNPVLLGEYQSLLSRAEYCGIRISKNKVFLEQGLAGLEIIDVTDSSNPILLGNYTDHYIWNIETMNDFVLAVTADSTKDFLILDARDPTDIQLFSYLDFEEEFVTDIALEGNRAYLLCSGINRIDSIRIVNVAIPSSPKVLSSTRIDFGNVLDIEVSGDYLYLASLHEGLIVLKDNFNWLSYVGQSSDTNIYGINLVVEKGYIYMASGWEGMTIFKAFTSMKLVLLIIVPIVIIVVLVIFVLTFRTIKKRRG